MQAYVEQATGRTLGADWPDFVRNETVKAFEAGVDAIPDVRSVIGMLVEHNVAFCVASSGRLEKMRTSLGKAGLLPLVEHALFSATMVDHGKPAPDLFLHAAKEMGCGPDTCVVIEDSIPGVQAGIAASMRVFGYAGDPHTDAEALRYEGAYVFHNMKALPDLLGIAQAPASNLGSVST